ncbi:hypothetical protein V9T40_013746 [Parthenolecanium corni]|uniref:Out at first protein n=1 Tax=Parthenolecanium corni TaxID=536013 RepID=A0AAN9TFI4_9HEMI
MLWKISFFCFNIFHPIFTQLVINVRNQGGEVLQETISSNISDDTVVLEYQNSDGTLITQFIDFKREVQVLKALVLGEEERGQSQYQVMCFVTHVASDDFIPSDALSKLRQKNKGTIRTAEENRGVVNKTLGILLFVPEIGIISKHAASICSEAMDSTFSSYSDLEKWSLLLGKPISDLMTMVKTYRKPLEDIKCSDVSNLWLPCVCRLDLYIPWYPCRLKFCKTSNLASSTYKCGIKTCRRGFRFSYYVKYKQLCLWDV